MKNPKTTSILDRLGRGAKANQNHASGIDADKKDPMTPLKDITKDGGIDGNAHRPLDKGDNKEPIDTSKGEPGHDDSTDKQDYAKEYEGIYKGKGSAETAAAIGKKLKEGVELKVNLDAMRSLLESSDADEEFISESLAIFEATMNDTLRTQIDTIVETAVELVESTIEEEITGLEEQVTEYLDVAVMEWAEDNRLAIEESTRAQIAESFMVDLTKLMESYNIALPEESVDLYEHSLEVGEQLIEENEQLETALAEARQELQVLNKTIHVESFISDSNLSLAESERLRNVSSEVEFINESDFVNKLNTITEGYIKRVPKAVTESKKNVTQAITESDDSFDDKEKETVYVDPMVQALVNRFVN